MDGGAFRDDVTGSAAIDTNAAGDETILNRGKAFTPRAIQITESAAPRCSWS